MQLGIQTNQQHPTKSIENTSPYYLLPNLDCNLFTRPFLVRATRKLSSKAVGSRVAQTRKLKSFWKGCIKR